MVFERFVRRHEPVAVGILLDLSGPKIRTRRLLISTMVASQCTNKINYFTNGMRLSFTCTSSTFTGHRYLWRLAFHIKYTNWILRTGHTVCSVAAHTHTTASAAARPVGNSHAASALPNAIHHKCHNNILTEKFCPLSLLSTSFDFMSYINDNLNKTAPRLDS